MIPEHDQDGAETTVSTPTLARTSATERLGLELEAAA
jgi:hypothetical protein